MRQSDGIPGLVIALIYVVLASIAIVVSRFTVKWYVRHRNAVRRWREASAEDWPIAEGHVESRIVRTDRIDRRTVYVVQIGYSYKSDDYYSGHLQREFTVEQECDAFVATFPKDQTILVRYNPEHTERSALLCEDQKNLLASAPIAATRW
jgi:Protein of unknown function (DUF3592)